MSLRQVHKESKLDFEEGAVEGETVTSSKNETDPWNSTYTASPAASLPSASAASTQEEYYKLMLKNEEAKSQLRTFLFHPKFLSELLASFILVTAAVISGFAASSAKNDVSALNTLVEQAKVHIVLYQANINSLELQYATLVSTYESLLHDSQLAFNRSLADAQTAYQAELAEVKLEYAALVSAFASSTYDAKLGLNNTLKLKQEVNSSVVMTLDKVHQVEHEIISFNQSYPYPWEIEAETKTHAQALNTVVGKLYYGCECRQVGCCYATVQLVPTKGAFDWEAFQIGGVTYLLVANSRDLSTHLVNSVLYRFDQGQPASPLVPVQNISTKFAWDWEAFQIGSVTYLLVANTNDGSTYLVNSVLYRFDEGQPASPLVQVQNIPTKGATDWEAFQIGNITYLLVANSDDGSTSLVDSVLYRFDKGKPANPLVPVQNIPTKNAHDWKAFQIGNITYLLVANTYDGSTFLVNSVLYRFDAGQPTSPLVQVQIIPTKGAYDWEVFQIGNITYLLVANSYDGSTVLVNSVLYRFDEGKLANPLVPVQNIPTNHAFDWKAFQIGNITYLLVANNGHDSSKYLVNSVLYRFDQGQPASPLVQVQDILTKGAFDWEAFQIGSVTYLLVANSYDGSTVLVNSVLFSSDLLASLL